MKRTGIFCLYSPSGEIDSTIVHTLKSMRKIVEYFIVVVNGSIRSKSELKSHADEILIRENIGLDIGAYKDVILSPDYRDVIKRSDELVLCNSSFYGPFIPFQEIFQKMDKSNSDFWGISSSEKNLSQHIQSYFLVFRHRVLVGEELFDYLSERVDTESIGYFDACSVFENGLFKVLRRAGYQFDAYKRNIDCDNYLNPYGSVKIDGLPVLKKKIFSKEFYQEKKVINALAYIKETYRFDIVSILEHAYKSYGIKLTEEDIKTDPEEAAEKDLFQDTLAVDRGEIEKFIAAHRKVFIYGNGVMARIVYSCFFSYRNHPGLEGFVVSDDQAVTKRSFQGYPVYSYSEIMDRANVAFLVALNKENTKEVLGQLRDMKCVQLLWKVN